MNASSAFRQSWADNAKALGMLLVIIGHSQLVNEPWLIFIYGFHMPLFFLISGYFGRVKEGETFGVFVNKNAWQLLVPYVGFYLLTMPFSLPRLWRYCCFWSYHHPHDMESWKWFIIRPILGFFSLKINDISFCTNTPLWFLIALFLIRLLFFGTTRVSHSGRWLALTAVASAGIFLLLEAIGATYLWCKFDVVFLAYPFYVMGHLLGRSKLIPRLSALRSWQSLFLAIVLFIIYNIVAQAVGADAGRVDINKGIYGNNLVLFYLIALLGTWAMIQLCIALPDYRIIKLLGGGTIVILACQGPLLQLTEGSVRQISGLFPPGFVTSQLLALALSIFIWMLCLPLIRFFNTYFPTLMGKGRKKERKKKESTAD